MKMFVLIIGFLSIMFSVSAQQFNGGLLVGISTSQVDGDNLAGFNKVGVKGGGFVNRNLSGKYGLQFEIAFVQKGSRKPLNTDDNTYYLMRLNYVDVPLLLQYRLNHNIGFEAGPAFATLVSHYEESEEKKGITGSPAFHKFDYLVNAGVNYFFSDHFSANVRFSYSMFSIRQELTPAFTYAAYYKGGQYNQVLAFSLVYSAKSP